MCSKLVGYFLRSRNNNKATDSIQFLDYNLTTTCVLYSAYSQGFGVHFV